MDDENEAPQALNTLKSDNGDMQRSYCVLKYFKGSTKLVQIRPTVKKYRLNGA
jgi:hypothetical protein